MHLLSIINMNFGKLNIHMITLLSNIIISGCLCSLFSDWGFLRRRNSRPSFESECDRYFYSSMSAIHCISLERKNNFASSIYLLTDRKFSVNGLMRSAIRRRMYSIYCNTVQPQCCGGPRRLARQPCLNPCQCRYCIESVFGRGIFLPQTLLIFLSC